MAETARHSDPEPGGDHLGDNTAVELLDGTLPERELARVEAHLARCEICRQLIAALGGDDSRGDQVPTLPLGSDAHLALEAGDTVGRFEVLSRIGAGGMGVVFAAYDRQLGRKVALKLLQSPKEDSVPVERAQLRFAREAQAIAQISHPNVVSVYDVGTYKSEVYIAMEFVEGGTLTRWLKSWQRPWRDIVDKFLQAGAALAEAHAGGLVHRDFKPDNVLVGADERVRVTDFGLARSLFLDGAERPGRDGDADSGSNEAAPRVTLSMLGHQLTRTGALIGTPRYMAPERFEGRETDARSDQFSFCVALYEALYRHHPFEGDTAMGLEPGARPLQPPPSEVPSWLHEALTRGLSVAASDRFPTMQMLLRAITPPTPPPGRIRLAIAYAVAVLALFATAYAVPALMGARDESAQRSRQVQALQQQVATLEREVGALMAEINTYRHNAGSQDEALRALQDRVAAMTAELAEAQAALAPEPPPPPDRQRPRSRPSGTPPNSAPGALSRAASAGAASAAGPTASPLSTAPGALSPGAGLGRDALNQPLGPIRYDLAMCFREWLERTPSERLLLGVRVEIGPEGTPALGKIRGLSDRVVRECVTGNLMRMRFPTRALSTVADYKFIRTPEGELRMSAAAVELRRSDDSDETDESDESGGPARLAADPVPDR